MPNAAVIDYVENPTDLARISEEFFRSIFSNRPDIEVSQEWPCFDNQDRKQAYSPRIDLTVGPYSISEGQRFLNTYEDMCSEISELQEALLICDSHNRNMVPSYFNFDFESNNRNPRCFVAMEIEKSGSCKHRLGDLVNASAMGCYGLIVAWDESIARSFVRIHNYFMFLTSVGKPSFDARNIIIVTKDQLIEIMHRFHVG